MNYIFVDLDDIIINTSTAKQRFFSALSELSQVPTQELQTTYNALKPEIGSDGWFEQLTSNLADQSGVQKNQIKDLLMKSFTFADIDQDFLNYLTQIDAKKILFTYGNEKFQNKKIEQLDLRHKFDEIIITAEDKAEFFLKLVKTLDAENIAIIDDQRKTLKAIKSQNHSITTFTKEQLFEFVKSKTTQPITQVDQEVLGGTI